MYKDELKEQIEVLKLSQKICKTNASEVISLSKEILRLARELERIQTDERSDIDRFTERLANNVYETLRRNKAAVMS